MIISHIQRKNMKKLLIIATLLASSTLFASQPASADDCTYEFNNAMGDCSVIYGGSRECTAHAQKNYSNCKIGLKTEKYTRVKSEKKSEGTTPVAVPEKHGH